MTAFIARSSEDELPREDDDTRRADDNKRRDGDDNIHDGDDSRRDVWCDTWSPRVLLIVSLPGAQTSCLR